MIPESLKHTLYQIIHDDATGGGGFFGSRDRINFQKWHVKRDPYFGLILFGSSRHFKGAMIFFYASVL